MKQFRLVKTGVQSFYFVAFLLFGWLGCCTVFQPANICRAEDNTDLMFVGEALDVITTASGREEGAWKAPVIADVISLEMIEQSCASDLSDLLESEPGFFISPSEAGYSVELRGIPDSVLFLYDSVPTGAGLNKTFNSINPYLSLESIKRIEIVKGPGSVLWGPDAFAGIVNIVPLTGKDFQGVETGLRWGSSQIEESAYIRWGGKKGDKNWFLALNGGRGQKDDRDEYNVVRFWGTDNASDPVSPESRYGNGTVDNPEFLELVGNSGVGDLFKLSTSFSFYNMPYTRSTEDDAWVWKEENTAFSGFIKLEGSKKYNFSSGFRWTAYMSWFNTSTEIVDLDLDSRDRVLFGELVHEKTVWRGNGLLTTGLSIRHEDVEDLPVWNHYYPDYFSSDNTSFLPSWDAYDYSILTTSVFSQYQHTIKQMDFWAGVRGDDHEASGSNISYNIGGAWNPSDQWGVKTSYGNAYRTPVAKQLQEGKTDMENIETLSVQTEWKPDKKFSLGITGFVSDMSDGYVEDPALGLSEPVNRRFYGTELKIRYSPLQDLVLKSGLSWVKSTGEDIHFRYHDYSYWQDGEIVDHYKDIYEPYDGGPELQFNTEASYQINEDISIRAECRYISERTARYLVEETIHTYDDVWLLDAGLKIANLPVCHLDADISFKNVFNTQYWQPGIYGPVKGDGFSVEIGIGKRF